MGRFAGDYSPDRHITTIGAPVGPGGADFTPLVLALGVIPTGLSFPLVLEGKEAGTFSSTARAVPVASTQVGSDGEVTRTRSLNRTGSTTFTCKHSSLANTVLSAYLIAFELGINLTFAVSQVDLNSGPLTTWTSSDSWVEAWPTDDRAETDGAFAWLFAHADLNPFLGSRSR